MQITEDYFKHNVGRAPKDDDLERCNCNKAGQIGHWACGWCIEHALPVFEDEACYRKKIAEVLQVKK